MGRRAKRKGKREGEAEEVHLLEVFFYNICGFLYMFPPPGSVPFVPAALSLSSSPLGPIAQSDATSKVTSYD